MRPSSFTLLLICISLFFFNCPKDQDKSEDSQTDNQDQKEPGQAHEPSCLDFFSSPTVDSISNGESFLTTNLIAQQDDWPTNGYLKLDSNNHVGDGKNLRIYNINMHLNPSPPVSWISFDFAELGGNNKIIVNNEMHNFSDFPDLQNIIIDQVGFSVEATQAGNNWTGSFTARGAIDQFAIGGQELWIDNLCMDRINVLIENRVNDPNNNQTNPNGSLPQFNNIKEIMDRQGILYVDKVNGDSVLDSLFMDQFDIYIWYLSPITAVSATEIEVIEDFVARGGALFILTESGLQMQFELTAAVLNQFGAAHGGNTIEHLTNNFNDLNSHVIYQSNSFLDFLSNTGIQQVYAPIASTVSGNDGEWTTLIQTDDAAIPPQEPLMIHREYENGQVLFSGDFSILFDVHSSIGEMDNDLLITHLLYSLSNKPL